MGSLQGALCITYSGNIVDVYEEAWSHDQLFKPKLI